MSGTEGNPAKPDDTLGQSDTKYEMRYQKLRKCDTVTIDDDAEQVEWVQIDGETYLAWLEPKI